MPKELNVHQLREIERMEEYQNPNPYPASPRMIHMVNVLVAALLLAMIVLLLVKTANATPAGMDQPICRAVTAAYYGPTVEIGNWPEAGYGWTNIPPEALTQEPILLYLDEDMTAGYALYLYQGNLYIFPHWSFEYRADASGNHGGTHDLCDVLIYPLPVEAYP